MRTLRRVLIFSSVDAAAAAGDVDVALACPPAAVDAGFVPLPAEDVADVAKLVAGGWSEGDVVDGGCVPVAPPAPPTLLP